MTNPQLIEALARDRRLSAEAWTQLYATYTPEDLALARRLACETACRQFGQSIYFRGIIEFTSYCKNDCRYCGIRCSNRAAGRYRLTLEDILACCEEGYENGFRTFVLQGGEDAHFTDQRMEQIIAAIHQRWPDCAITLSLGERSRASYERLYQAGARRYLLRHETADPAHYALLHPASQTLSARLQCLRDLKDIGYQTGCGMMIGSPGQDAACLAQDMLLMESLRPEMVGIGPFLPHRDTPMRDEPAGSVQTTLLALALTRLMLPHALIPATTALGTAEADGRQQGVLSGCNVVMPNLSPARVRKKYMLYDNKSGTELTAAQGIAMLRAQMEQIGYRVVVGRGDFTKEEAK